MDSYKPDLPEEARRRLIDDSVMALTRATSLNPYNHLYQVALADALDAAGKHDAALQAVQRALVLAPLYEEPRLALGMHYHRLRKFEEAEMAFIWAGQAKALNREGIAVRTGHHCAQPILRRFGVERGPGRLIEFGQ